MYIIKNGEAYIVKGDKAYKISFNSKKVMSIDEETSIDVSNEKTFTYDEMLKKMNVNLMVKRLQAKEKMTENVGSIIAGKTKELNSKIEELNAQLEEKEKIIKELNSQLSSSKKEKTNEGK